MAQLVCTMAVAVRLHEVALELKLGVYLYLGRGEELSGGREKN